MLSLITPRCRYKPVKATTHWYIFYLYLCFDLTKTANPVHRWHRRAYAVCVQRIFSKMTLRWYRGDKLLSEVIIFVFFAYKKYSHSFVKLRLNTWCDMDYFTDLRFWTLIVIITLLWEGQRAVRMHQKYLNLCSEDELNFYVFGTTWG